MQEDGGQATKEGGGKFQAPQQKEGVQVRDERGRYTKRPSNHEAPKKEISETSLDTSEFDALQSNIDISHIVLDKEKCSNHSRQDPNIILDKGYSSDISKEGSNNILDKESFSHFSKPGCDDKLSSLFESEALQKFISMKIEEGIAQRQANMPSMIAQYMSVNKEDKIPTQFFNFSEGSDGQSEKEIGANISLDQLSDCDISTKDIRKRKRGRRSSTPNVQNNENRQERRYSLQEIKDMSTIFGTGGKSNVINIPGKSIDAPKMRVCTRADKISRRIQKWNKYRTGFKAYFEANF